MPAAVISGWTRRDPTLQPNLLSHMAKACDGLDGDDKNRVHQNMNDMVAIVSRAFKVGSLVCINFEGSPGRIPPS